MAAHTRANAAEKTTNRSHAGESRTRMCAVLPALLAGAGLGVLPTARADTWSRTSDSGALYSSASADQGSYRGNPPPPVTDRSLVRVSGMPLPTVPTHGIVESTAFPARLVFLNGVNISGIRDQTLENVTVVLDANGNIRISAPQYEVSEQSSYHPLFPGELPRVSRGYPSLGGGDGRYGGAFGVPSAEQAQAPVPVAVPLSQEAPIRSGGTAGAAAGSLPPASEGGTTGSGGTARPSQDRASGDAARAAIEAQRG